VRNVIVRYRVTPARVEENADLVRAVYAELQEAAPPGLRYATFLEADGVSFVHVASHDDEAGANPLPQLPAFQRFQERLGERCDEPPVVTEMRQIGAYRPS
jgi:quinol monooxygenase YgiN